MTEIRVYGATFPDLLSAAAHMRSQPTPCASCGHTRHDGLLGPCGVYAGGHPGCRCIATVVLAPMTVYSQGSL